MFSLGFSINQRVTRPPTAYETRWAGILPHIACVNEHCDALDLYDKKPTKNYAISDNGTTVKDRLLSDNDYIVTAELDATLCSVGPFISTMKGTERVTSSLILPMTHGILHATSKDVLVVKYMYIK